MLRITMLLFWSHWAFAQPVSLDVAFRSALDRTETTAIQQSRLSQTDARVDQTRGRMLPNVSLRGNYLRKDESSGATAGRTNQSSSRITVEQPLFQPGSVSALSAAESTRTAQQRRVAASRIDVFSEVARSFYAVQAAEQDIVNLNATIKLTRDRITELRKRSRIGRSRSGEVLTAESQLAVLQSQLQSAEGQLMVARDEFAFITGLPREARLTDFKMTLLPSAKPINHYLELAKKRPDLGALRATAETARESVKVARSGHLPTLGLTGNYYLSRTGTTDDADWDVGVGVTIPIYEGGTITARVREAKELETEAELFLRQNERRAESQIRSAYHTFTASLDQVKALEKALAPTERAYREQARDYRYSMVTNLDVLQALNLLHDTKRTLDRARIQAASAWAQLQAATAEIPGESGQ